MQATKRIVHSPTLLVFFLCLVAVAWNGPRVGAQEEAPPDGLFVTVPNPITSDVANQVREKVERARRRPERRLTTIVFDFNPDSKPSGSSQYGPCRDLAKYLLGLHDVLTIAFVHNEVSRHTVLPVLACKELVMAHEATLGDVKRGQPGPLDDDQMLFYRQATRNAALWAIVKKMLDSRVEVIEGRRDGSIWYVARDERPPEGVLVPPRAPVVLPAGGVALLNAAEAQKFGLCKRILQTRQEVKDAYDLPASSLREDPLEGRTPVAWRVEVRGEVTRALDETLRRRIRRAIGQGANFLILELTDCGGGDTLVARELADFLRNLKDDRGERPVMTVAYIPQRAPDTATFLALGCTEIVMAPDAELGNFDTIVYEQQGGQRVLVEAARYRMMRDSLEGLAEEQGYPPLLVRGMLDHDLIIYRVRSRPGFPPERRLITQQEWDEDQKKENPHWMNPEQVKGEGQFLVLNGQRASDLGVARHLAENPQGLYTTYGLDPGKIREAGPDWLDDIAEFLRRGWVATLLVMIGILCLVLELKLPGIGLPGVISALCFVLFFWSHSQLAGQITMLAVLLFVLGLVLIGLEVFVLPGFGVSGVSGILLLIVSLGLVTLEKKPETAQEWVDFGNTLTVLGLSIMLAVIGALLVGKYLPLIPGLNRLALTPLAEQEVGFEDHPAAAEVHAELLGAIGTAATSLRPAGMARFGDDYVDVVADGSFVPAGARVQVIEIEGNRILVKEV